MITYRYDGENRKINLWNAHHTDDDDATRATFAAAFAGADFAEGVAAFAEKQKPQFP